MGTIKRGVRALVRSPMRAGLMMAVLAVSIGLALIMITVNGAFAQRLDDVRASVGTDVTVRPAGSFGGGVFTFGNGGARRGQGNVVATPTPAPVDGSAPTQPTITDADLQKLTSIPNVTSITRVVTARYSGTNLKAAQITPPAGANGGFGGANGGTAPQGFSPPIIVTGTDDPNTLATLGVQDVTISSGRSFTADDEGKNVAVLGDAVAAANNLTVGSTFDLDQTDDTTGETTTTTMTVIGTYTTGTSIGDNSMAMPIDTARTIFNRGTEIDQAIVKADSVDNVDSVSNAIKTALGTDKADVTTGQTAFDAISSPLSDAKSSSEVGLIVALIASAAIILFSIGLVARQRIREIGIMKAVGASSWNVVSQFAIETGIVAVGAAFLGALATFPLAQTVANGLVSSSAAATGPGTTRGGGGAFFQAAGGAAGRANSVLGSVSVAVSPSIFAYALVIAIVLAVVATAVPVWYVGRVRPAEVLRYE
ncbi:MAG: ABC transporter permease [Chloroflexota bacterium]